jgi:uncharacterized protein (DUF4415 family)
MKSVSTTETPVVFEADDDAPPLTQADFDRATFRVGAREVSRQDWQAEVQAQLGKQRVSIMLDTAVVAFFKGQADGKGYQTLINATLREAMQRRTLEDTLRRVIREELRTG